MLPSLCRRSSEVSAGCSRRPSCCSCRRSHFPLQPATLVLGILLAAADVDTVAIVRICVHVHDVAVLGSAHQPTRRYGPKILLQLSGIRGAHLKPRRREHPLRILLDRRACRTEEHRYGEEQGYGHEREVLLQLALDRICCSRTARARQAVLPPRESAFGSSYTAQSRSSGHSHSLPSRRRRATPCATARIYWKSEAMVRARVCWRAQSELSTHTRGRAPTWGERQTT